MLQLNSLTAPLSLQNPKPYRTNSLSSRQCFQSGAFRVTLTKSFNTNKNYNLAAIKSGQTEYYEDQKFNNSTGGGESPTKVFVSHTIYKGKAALAVDPHGPEFTLLDSGAYKISKEGFVRLQFAPAAGVRQYDWTRKQIFSLSVTEIGTIVSLGARESCEFFHDPNKGKSDEGKVRKVLKVEPLPDGSGVQNRLLNVEENIYIPITKAEFAVLISAFNYILPFLLGWHAFADSVKPSDVNRSNNASSRYGGDYEWNR